MKIYIKNFIPKEIKYNFLVKNITIYKDIYSTDGIFRIQNNNITKLIPQDSKCEYITDNNMDFIIDKSDFIFRKNIYTIPYQHVAFDIEQVEYKLYNNSCVSLIIYYYNKHIIDLYFYTKNQVFCKNVKNNIIEYISLLNDIKQY